MTQSIWRKFYGATKLETANVHTTSILPNESRIFVALISMASQCWKAIVIHKCRTVSQSSRWFARVESNDEDSLLMTLKICSIELRSSDLNGREVCSCTSWVTICLVMLRTYLITTYHTINLGFLSVLQVKVFCAV